MRVFCTVAELRSFTGAADRLNIAHSAVSKHVAMLEQRLAVRLLDRTSRRVDLTEVGETYLAQAQRILDSLGEMEAGVRKAATRPSGLLRISLPPWLVNADTARLLADYRAAFPEVTLDLVLDRVELGATHDYRDLDIALRVTNFLEENMVAHHLATLTFRLVAAPAYLDRHGRPESPDEVNGWPLLHYSAYSPDASVVFRSGHHVTFRPIMRSASVEMIYHAMCAGMGPAFMPSTRIERDVAEGRLEYVLPEETASPIRLYAFHPRRPVASAKIASFLGFIDAAFGEP
jgi:DNA-binding transcriptional LysR family regulator